MFKSFSALLCVTAMLCALAFASPADAQSRKELAAQNAALASRISVLESRMLTGDPAAERLLARMDSLETAQRNLTGEIERLAYERDNLKGEVEALISDVRSMQDLSNRIKIHLDAVDLIAQEQQNTRAPITYGPVSQGQPSSVPSAPIFKEQDLIISDGEGYADAADAYIASMRKDSQGVRAPDAMVRLAAALRELGNRNEACATLASFPSQFPNANNNVKEKARIEAGRTGC